MAHKTMLGNPVKISKKSQKNVSYPDLYEASITQLQQGLREGNFTSVDLVTAYLARIDAVNHKGPKLNAVIETNPEALAQAAVLDHERKTRTSQSPRLSVLHGIPILIKDSINTVHKEGMNTTSGSFALLGSKVSRDATVVTRLREAGAIILGKTNLSEWSNWRGNVEAGYSGRGGQTSSPYFPKANANGSSTGSGVAAAIGLAAGTIGGDTNGSIALPCHRNNIVGVRPTIGLVSRAGAIPISSHMDTIGPMCRCVEDVAILLHAIAGRDPLDKDTLSQPQPVPNYLEALVPGALKGARFGVPRAFQGSNNEQIAQFNVAVKLMRSLGAVVIDPAEFPASQKLLEAEEIKMRVMRTDFKVEINKYLAELPAGHTAVKTLVDIIKFNNNHPDLELIPPWYTDQSELTKSQATNVDEDYHAALTEIQALGRSGGIDGLLKTYNLDAILIPTHINSTTPAAFAGYPVVTVPLGFMPEETIVTPASPTIGRAPGLPFGFSIIGTAFTESKLLSYAFAYEQATHTRLKRKAFPEAIPQTQLKDVIVECA